MNKIEMASMVKDVCSYFERKVPSPNTLDLWFEKLERVPQEAKAYIQKSIQAKVEFPKNFPEVCWALFQVWLEVNPEKRETRQYSSCQFCVDGILQLAKYDEFYNAYVEYSANCGHCRQRSDEPKIPMMTLSQAKHLGYTVWTNDMMDRTNNKIGDPVFREVAQQVERGCPL